jgi:hypothetical protein
LIAVGIGRSAVFAAKHASDSRELNEDSCLFPCFSYSGVARHLERLDDSPRTGPEPVLSILDEQNSAFTIPSQDSNGGYMQERRADFGAK